MEQEFDEKRGITNEDIKKYEENQEKIYSENKFAKRYRITSGGGFEDFDDLEKAIKYLKKMILKFAYASINSVHSNLIKDGNR